MTYGLPLGYVTYLYLSGRILWRNATAIPLAAEPVLYYHLIEGVIYRLKYAGAKPFSHEVRFTTSLLATERPSYSGRAS